MRTAIFVYFVVVVFVVVSWGVNLNKLIKLDFEPSYKAEIIRGIGLIPIISPFIAWVEFDEEKKEVK